MRVIAQPQKHPQARKTAQKLWKPSFSMLLTSNSFLWKNLNATDMGCLLSEPTQCEYSYFSVRKHWHGWSGLPAFAEYVMKSKHILLSKTWGEKFESWTQLVLKGFRWRNVNTLPFDYDDSKRGAVFREVPQLWNPQNSFPTTLPQNTPLWCFSVGKQYKPNTCPTKHVNTFTGGFLF